MIYLLITMYFNGGLIPTYLVVQSLGLYDTPLVIILIGLVTGTNVVIAKTYLQDNIPDGIYESAVMDGCNHFLFVWKMVFPLSKALIAVLALYYGIVHWNDFFNALIYLDNSDLMPLQIVLRSILLQNQATADVAGLDDAYQKQQTMELMKYSLIIVATIPMLIAYPFFQRYFVQGVTVGAVKG